ncbi:MAG: VWA domain-containing protein [Deltaproteobacteria bacterium]|nr:MAG: VWA domain-containing protein [Deltaproteobacteria bacterium]
MKKWMTLFFLAVFPLILPVKAIQATLQDKVTLGEGEDKTLSPYFFVQGDSKLDRFPLLKTEAKAAIAGIVAEVELTQAYKNDGKRTIEAIYVFPLGTKSAIHAMKMKIGDRVIEAKIEEKERAQKVYQKAKDEGKVASLLEQKRPNVFQMKVANIMPGDTVEVVVKYTEILVPEKGVYEFVFPTVVGPRFTGEKDKEELKGKDRWVATPYLHEGEEPPYKFDIKVNLKTGLPLSKVSVTSHKVEIKRPGLDEAKILLSPEEKKGGNRDFIVRYTLQGEAIQTGLLLYPGEEEKFFLMMLEPPERVSMKMVPPREYVFIVDVSGSMNGFPLDVSKTLIKRIIGSLREKDYFNILFFAGGSETLSPHPLPATQENQEKAINMLLAKRGGGGTRILDALKRSLSLEKKEGLSRIIVIATDGYVAVEKEAFDLIKDNLGQANFFSFGIGTGVNRFLIEGIARVGLGEPFVVSSGEEAEKAAEEFMDYIEHPLLTDIKVRLDGFDAYEVEPYSLPDLFAQRPLILFGKYKNASGKIRVRGKTVKGDYKKEIAVNSSVEDENNIALKYLWAREKIARLSDYGRVGAQVIEDVKNLGLKYHLMTEYTSFVAVDTLIRETGEVVTVKQPLPLPEGVSDYAVGHGVAKKAVLRQAAAPQALEERVYEHYNSKRISQIYVTGGKLPSGITLDEIEKAVLSQIKKEMEEAFKEWKLKSLVIVLEVEKGSVKAVKIKKYEGKECKEGTLKNIFKKLRLPASLKGVLELNIEYM